MEYLFIVAVKPFANTLQAKKVFSWCLLCFIFIITIIVVIIKTHFSRYQIYIFSISYILCSCQIRITLSFFERKCRRCSHSLCAETISFMKLFDVLFEEMIDDSKNNNTSDDEDVDDDDAIRVITILCVALVALGIFFERRRKKQQTWWQDEMPILMLLSSILSPFSFAWIVNTFSQPYFGGWKWVRVTRDAHKKERLKRCKIWL